MEGQMALLDKPPSNIFTKRRLPPDLSHDPGGMGKTPRLRRLNFYHSRKIGG